MNDSKSEELFEKIAERLTKYAQEKRATIQRDRAITVTSQNPEYDIVYKDPLVSENLLEHVGTLPIIATAIFPYLQRDDVDLGEALIMLAVHDIGEIEVGDVVSFNKDAAHEDKEREAALKMLDGSYHQPYLAIEDPQTPTAKFAMCIDKISPDFFDYLCPSEIILPRYRTIAGIETSEDIIQIKRRHKEHLFAWDPLMAELFELMMQRLQKHIDREEAA